MTDHELVQFLGAGAIGAVSALLTTMLTQGTAVWLARRNRLVGERREAYVGFLDAYREVMHGEVVDRHSEEAQSSEVISLQYGKLQYWVSRIELAGSMTAIRLARDISHPLIERAYRRQLVREFLAEARRDLNLNMDGYTPSRLGDPYDPPRPPVS